MAATVRSTSKAVSSAANFTVAAPAGVATGDILVMWHSCDGTAASMGVPTGGGWEPLGGLQFDGVLVTKTWAKEVTGVEPDAYGITQTANDGTVIVVCVRNPDGNLVATKVAGNEGTPLTSPPLTPNGADDLLLRYIAAQAGDLNALTWTEPAGHTLLVTAQDAPGFVAAAVASKALSSSTLVPAADWGANPASGADYHHGFSVSIGSSSSTGGDAPPPVVYPPFAPGRGSGRYRYVFRRLMDGVFLGEIDLAGVAFDKRILQPGSFTGTIPIPNRQARTLAQEIIPSDPSVLTTGPGVIVCDVIRAGEPWGEYWITGARPSRSRRGTPAITLRGSTLDAYLLSVELQDDLAYTQIDQIAIARELLNHMQGQPRANIGLQLQAGTSGMLRDRTYLDSDRASYGQRLRELAEVDGGFEHMINIAVVDGTLQRQWVWGYPRLGAADVRHVYSDARNGGEILEWSEEHDALRGATRWRARGDAPQTDADASTQSVPLVSTAHEATAHLAAGWPRIDRTIYRQGVTIQQTLEDYAAYWASVAPGVLRVDQITVALGAEPTLTPNDLGDKARIFLTNEWHAGEVRERRIIGMKITPVSRQSGLEEADLVLEGQETPDG
ncbi:hypothetical protein [Streptosporangium sp. G12]